jgi:heavy metal sensor kinase
LRRPFNTIGFRLTLWGTGVTLLVCVLLFAILYAGLFYCLRGQIDGFLEGEAHELTATLEEHGYDLRAAQQAIRLELGSRSNRDLNFRLLAPDGRVLLSSDASTAVGSHVNVPAHITEQAVRPHYRTVPRPGEPYPERTCNLPVQRPDGTFVIAQSAYLLDRMTTSLALFRRMGVAALIFIGLFALVGARILANRSLRPIGLMTATAQQIGLRVQGSGFRVQERLPRSNVGDELDRLAETLNSMLDRIERHVNQLQRFTADASHELRSPLAALRGSAEVALTRHRSADELRRVIEESIEHYDRLSRIAEDLLLLARADAGDNILRRERLRLDQAVADVVDLYAPLASERDIKISFDEPREIWVDADGAHLRRLIGNLLDNAIKYSEPGAAVSVALSYADGLVGITVSDTGIGIASEDALHVFDRFYRVDRARTPQRIGDSAQARRAGGAGLGLSICRAIAEAHGGRIELSSALGQGTTVRLFMPAAERPEPAASMPVHV